MLVGTHTNNAKAVVSISLNGVTQSVTMNSYLMASIIELVADFLSAYLVTYVFLKGIMGHNSPPLLTGKGQHNKLST